MIKVKFYFSIFLLLIAGFLFFASINKINIESFNVFEIGNDIVKGEIKQYSLEEVKKYSCTLEEPANRTVILRIDDIARWQDFELMENMINEITERNYGVTLGVIPNKLEEDYGLIKWIQKINENPLIELSQHGYDHSTEEFGRLNYEDATERINLGRDLIIRLFGEVPINFIPPYNVDSEGTIKALEDLDFKTFSGNILEYDFEPDFVKAGYTATTYYYSEDRFVYAEEVLENCKESLDGNGVCVIMFHPQDFTEEGKIVDWKYAEYVKVLDGLKDLDAQVVNFRQAFCEEY